MLSKSTKWELGLVHYIVKFTISRFVISRFECILFWVMIWKLTAQLELGIFFFKIVYDLLILEILAFGKILHLVNFIYSKGTKP